MTPRASIEAECSRRGRSEVVAGCRALLRSEPVDPLLLMALAGPAARRFLGGADHPDDYWLRVWGARGLLWVWDDAATGELRVALGDEAWRVREMAAKVVARHGLGDLMPEVAGLREDPVPRVRDAAQRAVVGLTASGA